MLLATSGGCLHPLWKHDRPVEYHTVAATSQGDEETAAAKHAEALVFIEDYRWPKDLVKAELLLACAALEAVPSTNGRAKREPVPVAAAPADGES